MLQETSHTVHADQGVEVYFVATYPPRNCGIATFTYDLAHAVGEKIGEPAFHIVAMNNPIQDCSYPQEVAFEIAQNQIHDYRIAADYINVSREGVVSLQARVRHFRGAGRGVHQSFPGKPEETHRHHPSYRVERAGRRIPEGALRCRRALPMPSS